MPLSPIPLALTLLLSTLPTLPAAAKPPSHDDIAGKPALTAPDAERDLKRTVIAPTLEHPVADGRSVVWCSTMQITWNELSDFMGGPLKAEAPADSPGSQLVAAFNTGSGSKADLDEAAYVAMAGFGRDGILDKIRQRLQTTFKGQASPKLLPQKIDPDSIFAYSYLFKNLAFEHPFIRRPKGLDFAGTQVAAFGLWDDQRLENWGKLAAQVSVLSYASPTDWCAELKSTAAEDRLIIARMPRADTLKDTVDSALARARAAKPERMGHRDTLLIPLINFDITRSFSDLVGLQLTGTKASGPILAAMQNIRFRLDERGAVLKSEASMAVGSAMIESRDMICDGPFLVLMMRKEAANPYFAMWVDNPELLVKFDR